MVTLYAYIIRKKNPKKLPSYPPEKFWVGAKQKTLFLMMAYCPILY